MSVSIVALVLVAVALLTPGDQQVLSWAALVLAFGRLGFVFWVTGRRG